MFDQLLSQARRILGARDLHSNTRWLGQMGFSCDQLGIYEPVWGPNRVVNSGLNHMLNAALRGEDITTVFYLAPFLADVAPAATLTAVNFNSSLTEFTNYSEATRPVWTSDGPSTAQQLENLAAPALITIAAGAQTTIAGAVLHSNNVKGGTTGFIFAGAKAPSAFASLATGFEVKLRYRVAGTSS